MLLWLTGRERRGLTGMGANIEIHDCAKLLFPVDRVVFRQILVHRSWDLVRRKGQGEA